MAKTLPTWRELNEQLRDCTEDEAKRMLRLAIRVKAELRLLLRIHSRINRLRAMRERSELAKINRPATRRNRLRD